MGNEIENNQVFLLNQTVHSLSWSDVAVKCQRSISYLGHS